MVNGHYRSDAATVGYLGDLGCCGCESGASKDTSGLGFNLDDIPLWAWIAAGVAAFFLVTKKER